MVEENVTAASYSLLEDYIEAKQNDEAKLLLSEILQFSPFKKDEERLDKLGQLLLHSSSCNNDVMVEHLLQLGAQVDYSNKARETSLKLAVRRRHLSTIKVLLKANANFYLESRNGLSVLQEIVDSKNCHHILVNDEISKLLLEKLQAATSDLEELVDDLEAAGCELYHVAYFRDVQLMEGMLELELDVNTKDSWRKRTALHVAAELNHVDMAKWLVDSVGAVVDSLDKWGNSPLLIAANLGNSDVIRVLLERGADPNVSNNTEKTAFAATFLRSTDENVDETDECLELLFQYGAVPRGFTVNSLTLLDMAMTMKVTSKISILMDHLSMFRASGRAIDESIFQCNHEILKLGVPMFLYFLDMGEKHLKCKTFGNLSMLQLLTDDERKMRIHARNETLVSEVQEYCLMDANKKKFRYYCKSLMKRMSKAVRVVQLEDAAIPAICGIFNGNHNECYIPARKIVGYLDEEDLEQLSRVSTDVSMD